MKNFFKKLLDRRPRLVVVVMGERERAEAFLGAPGSDLWRAVLAEVDELAMEVSDRALEPGLGNEAIREHLGGQGALLELKARLLERERVARQREEETTNGHE